MVTETFTAGQDFTVPDGVFSLTLELEGEGGGGGKGGDGGRVVGDIEVRPGDVVFIRDSNGGDSTSGGDGGDSVDVRRGGTALSDRVAVAAGGGGQAENAGNAGVDEGRGGAGGADTGESGYTDTGTTGGPTGGTQTAGGNGTGGGEDGSFGQGGDGEPDGDFEFAGGAGGAGWYGGGGGEKDDLTNQGTTDGGAGGSNYDDGLDIVTANERGTSTRTHGEGGLVTITYDAVPGAKNLAITDTTATSNTLDWDAPTLPPEVDSIDQYRVYRDTDTGADRSDYTEIDTTPDVGYVDSGLDTGTKYHYRIGADLVVN
jgi:hypothetical protein